MTSKGISERLGGIACTADYLSAKREENCGEIEGAVNGLAPVAATSSKFEVMKHVVAEPPLTKLRFHLIYSCIFYFSAFEIFEKCHDLPSSLATAGSRTLLLEFLANFPRRKPRAYSDD